MSKKVISDKAEIKKKGFWARLQANFFVRLLIALILSSVVWLTINTMYVNPPGEQKFNVTLYQLNKSTLENRNLELRTETISGSVDVYFRGRQEDLDAINYREIEAFIDFGKITGSDDTRLDVELQTAKLENVSIARIDPAFVTINVEERETRIIDITVRFTGEPADGFYRTGYSYTPATNTFSARKSLVNQIDRVEVVIDQSGLAGNTVIYQQCRIYRNDGNEMKRPGWEQSVAVSLEISKDVQVKANVTGSPAEDHYVRYTTISPENVRINGTKEALEQVDVLYTDVLDIAFSRQDISRALPLIMPNNVRLSNNTLPRAVIDVTIYKNQYTQDIALSKNRIELINCDEEYRYEVVESEIPLLLKGKVDDIAGIDPGDVSAVVDVKGLAAGTSAVKAIVNLPDGIISVNDVLVNVIIAKK